MFNQDIFQKRVEKLQKKIKKNQLVLLSSPSDITYFSDFSFLVPEEREAFLLVSKTSVNLVFTSFSPINDFSYLNYFSGSFPNQLATHLEKIVEIEKTKEVLINSETLFVAELDAIKSKLPEIKIGNYEVDLVQSLRNVKGAEEIEEIKKAAEITSKVMEAVREKLEIGVTELEVKDLIKKLFEEHGAKELAFPTIVAFGENSALPHHQPGKKRLEEEMAVLIDIGAKVGGYCSDMTRSFWFGKKPSKKFIEIETIVRDAYKETFKMLANQATTSSTIETVGVAAKLKAKDLDNAARTLITNNGYAENFIHTTGHGLGLSIHEQPSVSWKNTTEILPGMVITIEPGIYLEGDFGYRYENTVLVTKDGSLELTVQKN